MTDQIKLLLFRIKWILNQCKVLPCGK